MWTETEFQQFETIVFPVSSLVKGNISGQSL